MSLKEARAAAAELNLFLEENKCKSQDDMIKKVRADLSRMTVTARHVQLAVSAFFGLAQASRNPVWQIYDYCQCGDLLRFQVTSGS